MRGNNDKIGIILLAAGESKRLGKPKQLLEFNGETLLGRAVKTALATGCRPVVVVLGANAGKLRDEIENTAAIIIENTNWEKGMSSSIKTGLKFLQTAAPDISGTILMVCDQPFVSVELIEQLIGNFRQSNAPIVAATYGETIGVPALFSRRLFPELLNLESDGGAKKLIHKHREKVVRVSFPKGVIDVDTAEDYLNLTRAKADF